MIKLSGISPRVDSCARLVAKEAFRQYHLLHQNDKRWIDPEDMLQEGLLAACEAEAKYLPVMPWKMRPKLGPVPPWPKFSTYLYTGLKNGFSQLQAPLRQMKRTTKLVEMNTTNLHDQLKLVSEIDDPGDTVGSVHCFIHLCQTISPRAVMLLAEGLLVGSWTGTGSGESYSVLLKEIREACWDFDIDYSDLKHVVENDRARITALIQLSEVYSMGLGKNIQAEFVNEQSRLKILTCRECHGQFGLDAIADGKYFVSTFTCLGCYEAMAEKPPSVSCFGKVKKAGADGHVISEGYSLNDVECRLHCIDRKVCKSFQKEEAMSNVEATKKSKGKMPPPSMEDVDIDISDLDNVPDTVEVPAVAPKKSTKTSISLKPAEEKKKKATAPPVAEPEPEEEDEEEIGETDEETEEPEEEEEEEGEAPPPPPVKTKKAAAAAPAPAKTSKKAAPVPAATGKKAAATAAAKKDAKKDAKKVGPLAGNQKLEDLYAAPAEIGYRWPHKRGSVMRYCFQRAFKGVKAAELQSEVEKFGRSWTIMLKVLRDGFAGKERTTHRWNLEEGGGKLKVINVKPQFEYNKEKA